MRQDQIEIGGDYTVRIGDRLAPVTVLRAKTTRTWGSDRARTVYVCLTGDTRREIVASAARLRPAPGAAVPVSRSAEADARRKAAKAAAAKQAATAAELAIYGRAAATMTPPWTAEGLRDHAEAWLERLPGEGSRVDHRAALLRSLDADPRRVARSTWDEVIASGRDCSGGGPLSRPAAHPGAGLLYINRDRAVELPVGGNLAGLRDRLSRVHVAESLLGAARRIQRTMPRHRTRRLPVPMRRGLWQAVAMIHADNRATYRAVMGHAPLPSERQVTEAVGLACGLGAMPR